MAESAAEASDASSPVKRLGVFNQLFRFIGIGGVCAVLDYGSYMTMLALDVPNWLARSLAFILGTSTSYVANRRFTFKGAASGNRKAQASGFAIVYTITFFVNVGVNQVLFSTLPEFAFAYGDPIRSSVCWVVGQGLGTLINFVMLKWVIFRD
ncbi:GtrA family protein [Parasphingorhabdus pacifica]